MTYLCASVNSWSLGINERAPAAAGSGTGGRRRPPGYAVLYLLHGYGRRRRLDAPVAPGTVPGEQTGGGGDAGRRQGLLYRHLFRRCVLDLPFPGAAPVHRNEFCRVQLERERTFAAGLSMGGYGALKLALRRPEALRRGRKLFRGGGRGRYHGADQGGAGADPPLPCAAEFWGDLWLKGNRSAARKTI